MQNHQSKDSNELKNLDFLSWQIKRAKQRHHDKQVNLILSQRPRLRSPDHLNG